jgi:hypothetical protein
MKNPKHRAKIFREIRELYDNNIITYNLSIVKMANYQGAHLKIATLLESLETDKVEICLRLGEEFTVWFYTTHDKILDEFWYNFIGENNANI